MNWISYSSKLEGIKGYFKINFEMRPEIIPNIILPNFKSIKELIKFKKGISVIPTYLVKPKDNLKKIFLDEKLFLNKIYILYKKELQAHKKEIIKKIFGRFIDNF